MSKNQQYAERYAAEAMEQMKRYGIPASVTLRKASWKAVMDRVNCRSWATTTLA